MKTIIYNLKFAAIALFALNLSSCDAVLDDDITDYGEGPSVVRFPRAEITAPFEVTGEQKTFNAPINLVGSEFESMTEDITVTFSVDEANSTAEEGVHYSLPSNTVTLTREDNYMGTIPVTVYTEGVEPPTEETLVLTITDFETSSPKDIVVSGIRNNLEITISYICFADLSGTYTMTNSVCDPQVKDITITPNEDGGWDLSTADGGLLQYCTSNTGLVNGGSIIVVCGEVLPAEPSFCGSNGIGCITGGTWDAESGILTMTHSDTFFGVGEYTSTYTRTSGGNTDGGDSEGDDSEGDESEEEE